MFEGALCRLVYVDQIRKPVLDLSVILFDGQVLRCN